MTRLGSGLSREIQSLKSKFDTLIIDTGGRDTSEMRQSLVVSDIAIIPTIPSQYDVIILDKMLAIIAAVAFVAIMGLVGCSGDDIVEFQPQDELDKVALAVAKEKLS